MKILILNPPDENTIIEHPDEKGEYYIAPIDYGSFPPLGALYVLSYLEDKTSGHDLYFIDCYGERISHEELYKKVDAIKPDLVGVTSYTVALVDVCLAARNIRKVVPLAHICLGGHHPMGFPYEAAKLDEFDSIIVGEGEIPFTALVKALETGHDITRIQGLYTSESIEKWRGENYKDKRLLSKVSVPTAYIEDIDTLPIPNRSYIKHTRYHSTIGVRENLATILTSRGCPYRCIFCDVPYKQYRKRSAQKVVDEIEECLRMGYEEFHFFDDLFNVKPQRVIEFCDEVERRNLKFIWDFRGRVNTVTRESLERVKKAGCRLISFGIETGSDEGLKYLKKGTTVQKIKEVVRWCKELKIKVLADYMIGLPFERTKEDVLKSIDFLIKLDPDYAQIAIFVVLPNTEAFSLAVEKGLTSTDRWDDFCKNPRKDFKVDVWNEYLTHNELIELQRKGYKKFYLRPSYIIKSIYNTRSVYEFLTKAKGALTIVKK